MYFIFSTEDDSGSDSERIESPTPHNVLPGRTNPFRILSQSPDPTSSQSSVVDYTARSGLSDVNMDTSQRAFDLPGMGAVPTRKNNHEGVCEVRL